MAYDFSISGSTLVVTLDTESGKFAESITVYSQPNLVLGNDRIFLKQEGLFLQEFTFENIGDINGDTATNLISAYELLDSLIKSIFVTTAQVDSRPYKVYTALLTQTGTDAPVATVLENTLGEIVWSRDIKGIYTGTLLNTFIEDKTHLILTNNTYNLASYPSYNSFDVKDTDSVRIVTTESTENIDGNLYNTPIEIRVYN